MKIGNLFEMADKQLRKEFEAGTIPCYTIEDIIEYAKYIRKWLDNNSLTKIKKITNLTKDEIKRKNRIARMNNYYAKLERR